MWSLYTGAPAASLLSPSIPHQHDREQRPAQTAIRNAAYRLPQCSSYSAYSVTKHQHSCSYCGRARNAASVSTRVPDVEEIIKW